MQNFWIRPREDKLWSSGYFYLVEWALWRYNLPRNFTDSEQSFRAMMTSQKVTSARNFWKIRQNPLHWWLLQLLSPISSLFAITTLNSNAIFCGVAIIPFFLFWIITSQLIAFNWGKKRSSSAKSLSIVFLSGKAASQRHNSDAKCSRIGYSAFVSFESQIVVNCDYTSKIFEQKLLVNTGRPLDSSSYSALYFDAPFLRCLSGKF